MVKCGPSAIKSGSDSGQRLSEAVHQLVFPLAGRWAGYVRRGRRSMVVRGGVMSQLGLVSSMWSGIRGNKLGSRSPSG